MLLGLVPDKLINVCFIDPARFADTFCKAGTLKISNSLLKSRDVWKILRVIFGAYLVQGWPQRMPAGHQQQLGPRGKEWAQTEKKEGEK